MPTFSMAFESTAICLRFYNFRADRLHIHICDWDGLGYLPERAREEKFPGGGGNRKNKTEK